MALNRKDSARLSGFHLLHKPYFADVIDWYQKLMGFWIYLIDSFSFGKPAKNSVQMINKCGHKT